MNEVEEFEKWWQALPLRNGEISSDHVRQAWDAGFMCKRQGHICGTVLPFEIAKGDGTLLGKALREYRPETSEDEGIITFFIEQF